MNKTKRFEGFGYLGVLYEAYIQNSFVNCGYVGGGRGSAISRNKKHNETKHAAIRRNNESM